MDEPPPREEAISTLLLLSALCLLSFVAVWTAPLPPTDLATYLYLRYFTGILLAGSIWCTAREIRYRAAGGVANSMPQSSSLLWPLLCVGLAAWLRFRNITAIDTWQDEDHQLSGALVRDNLVLLAAWSQQAPLDYFNSHFMLKTGGVNLFTARLLPAIMGSAAVIPFYRLLRSFVREESAVLGTVFFLGNTLLWSLSQEGRPYMTAVFLFVVSLQMWVAFCENPKKRHLWVAFVASQAALSVTLAMQPQFAYGFYFIPLAIYTLAGNRMHFKAYASATILSGIVALPALIPAAVDLQEEPQIQPFAPGFLADFWQSMLGTTMDCLGPLLWAAPLLPIALFLNRRDTNFPALGKSLLALAIIYPFLFFFCFEAVLSHPIAPRYITFLVVLYIFALTYSLDSLATAKGYRYLAFACAFLFFASAVSAESLKTREPAWRQFFEYVHGNESSRGVGAVLDFPLNWHFPLQGFRGAYIYLSLYENKLSIRSNSERTLSATGDLIRRLQANPQAKFAYLYFPENHPDNLLFQLKIPPAPERQSLTLNGAVAIRIEPKDGNLPRAIRETLVAASSLDPRITQIQSYSELMSGLFALEKKCASAMEYWPKLSGPRQGYADRETSKYLKAVLAERCGAH